MTEGPDDAGQILMAYPHVAVGQHDDFAAGYFRQVDEIGNLAVWTVQRWVHYQLETGVSMPVHEFIHAVNCRIRGIVYAKQNLKEAPVALVGKGGEVFE